VERAHWNDDDPSPAPLPAHERGWRHPSEVGDHLWRTSEPPIAIGRGLTLTTGAIGTLIAAVVVLTMVSTAPGGDAVVTARSTTFLAAPTSVRASVVAPPSSSPSSDAPQDPLPTVAVHVSGGSVDGVVATPVSGGTLLVTTAGAVDGRPAVAVEFDDGSITVADVVFVDQRSGLAVLTTTSAHETPSLTVAADIAPGDVLTVAGDPAWSMVADEAGSIADAWAELSTDDGERRTPAEGAPVVNQRGELVALCSHDGETLRMVQLTALHRVSEAISGATVASPVWLGVVVADAPDGELTVSALDPEGPAAQAGLTEGDVLLTLDDEPLADCRTLIARLALHLPGDTVAIGLRRSDGSSEVVLVELAEPPASV